MTRRVAARLLDSPLVVPAASAASLLLGLFFIFVWAPHPWSWQGIDQYHELALALARGEPFGTTDVPWGYAYYVAAFYMVFGEHALVPVLAQAFINALVPVLLHRLVRPFVGQRVAALAALIVGIFSFNTVYASTQASDTVCTVLFLASLLCFARGVERQALTPFLAAGVLSGLVPQFRPNMILLPGVMIALYLAAPTRSWRKVGRMAAFAACIVLALSPWIVRNYRLTGLFMPTSTHGGVQLWYGSLQVGPYLESRSANPRSIFESPAFDYTSLANTPIVVSADRHPCVAPGEEVSLVYWSDRDSTRRAVMPVTREAATMRFNIPGQPAPAAVYYYFASSALATPTGGSANPLVLFVSTDHLGDLDRHGDLLDAFDVVALMRHLAWGDPLGRGGRLDLDRDGEVGQRDLAFAVEHLATKDSKPGSGPAFVALEPAPGEVTLRLSDQSTLTVPREFSGRLTDVDVRGELAGRLVTRADTFSAIAEARRQAAPSACRLVEQVRINDVFYRREPHTMQRYLALAFDNITRDPGAFAAASAYRMFRLFIIRSTEDSATSYQYEWSRLAYGAGMVLSAAYLAVFLAGVVLAWRQRSALLWLLVPIIYVPLTICFVLTNMRYTVTVQPLMFAFVAVALEGVLRLDRDGAFKPLVS